MTLWYKKLEVSCSQSRGSVKYLQPWNNHRNTKNISFCTTEKSNFVVKRHEQETFFLNKTLICLLITELATELEEWGKIDSFHFIMYIITKHLLSLLSFSYTTHFLPLWLPFSYKQRSFTAFSSTFCAQDPPPLLLRFQTKIYLGEKLLVSFNKRTRKEKGGRSNKCMFPFQAVRVLILFSYCFLC